MTVRGFFAALLPFVQSEAEKVAPEVKAQIDAILKAAQLEANRLKSNNSVATLRAQMQDDIKAVEDTAKHHVALIKADFDQKVAAANAVLPPVSVVLNAAAPASTA